MIFGLFKKRAPRPEHQAMMLMGLFKATIDRFLLSKGADPSKLRLENKIVAYALTTTRSLCAVVSDSPTKVGISLPASASIYQKAVILLIGMECIQMLYAMAHPPELGNHNQEDLVRSKTLALTKFNADMLGEDVDKLSDSAVGAIAYMGMLHRDCGKNDLPLLQRLNDAWETYFLTSKAEAATPLFGIYEELMQHAQGQKWERPWRGDHEE